MGSRARAQGGGALVRRATVPSTANDRADGAEPPPLRSQALLAGARVRAIEHGAERYFLRLTRTGKLILTK